jgi:hypothetical protein
VRILVACEFSGVVRRAFRTRGHDAWSCDLLPAEDGSEFHLQRCVLSVMRWTAGGQWRNERPDWDLMIAHPPCTHLAVSGARHFAAKQASGVQQEVSAQHLANKFRRRSATARARPSPMSSCASLASMASWMLAEIENEELCPAKLPLIVGDYWLDKRRDGLSPDIWQVASYAAKSRSVVYRSTKQRTVDLERRKSLPAEL